MKNTGILPLFEFPSSIVIVDDNIDYIQSLKLLSTSENIRVIPFNDPHKALLYLNEQTYCTFKNEVISANQHSTEIFGKAININLSSLYKEIYNKSRFEEISVLVIDYAMPGLNGQQFCEEISLLPIKKLLLTGEATFEDAVSMFNNVLIDRFLKKEGAIPILFENIRILQKQYFEMLTKDILSSIDKIGSSIFFDKIFISFFNSLCEENEFIEYYAIDDNGSYLLADKFGKLKLLIVKSEEEMKVLYELAEGDFNSPPKLLEELHEKKKITIFQTVEDFDKPLIDWALYDATPLKGEKETYFYALVDVDRSLEVNRNKVTSYNDFVRG